MLATQLRILRVFGPSATEMSDLLRSAQEEGCPGLRLLEKDGEFAVCIQASAQTQEQAAAYSNKWVEKLSERFGDNVYGDGEITMAQATLDALLQKRRLVVAADEPTGRLVGTLMRPLNHAEAVFDFGTHTYADPTCARRIQTPPALLKKFPGDVLQAAAGRALSAAEVAGADYGMVYMPATVGQAPFVLLCDKRAAVAAAVSPELSPTGIANNLLDLVRRRVLGLNLAPGVVSFKPGHETPLLLVSQEGSLSAAAVAAHAAQPQPAKAAPVAKPGKTADSDEMRRKAKAAAAALFAGGTAGAGVAAASAAAQKAQAEQAKRAAEVAAAARAAMQRQQREPEAELTSVEVPSIAAPGGTIRFEEPQAAAPVAPAAAEPEVTLAADEQVPEIPLPKQERSRPAPAHSLLDDEIPAFQTPTPVTQATTATAIQDVADDGEDGDNYYRSAAQNLFFPGSDTDVSDDNVKNPVMNHSLAMIERTERRQRQTTRLVLGILAVLLIAAIVMLVMFLRNNLGSKPEFKSYGTSKFDEQVETYLTGAQSKQAGIAGYLAFPGADGSLVYETGSAPTEKQVAFGGALAADETTYAAPTFYTENRLGSDYPSSTMLDCGSALVSMSNEDTLKSNSGFTYYANGATYRCKVLAVYYWDPSETGDGAFDLANSGDLSSYYDSAAFACGLHIRSLYTTAVDQPDDASYLTLLSDSDQNGIKLCVTARIVGDNEDQQLEPSAIAPNDGALRTAAQYAATGESMPDVRQLLMDALSWYTTRGQASETDAPEASEETAESDPTGGLTGDVANMAAETESLLASADELMAGLTDVAGQTGAAEADITKGAEGTLPSAEIAVDTVASSTTTADGNGEDSSAAENGGAEAAAQTSSNGETINVTMNGSQQTMDLVTCLAMVAQNELGSSAPAEAYKAQCVATHCWILSQGGYPSVYGATPGSGATAAAQEVAHVLVTYNGSVCFTPYFASASTGTASSADVWGGSRAWLQAVDSPYDQSVASNWNTNGNSSGSARFSRDALQQAVNEKLGIDLSGTDPNQWFKILATNAYGWVTQIQVGPDGNGQTVSGRWFRESLTAGKSVDGRSLRSQCFTFTYDDSMGCFVFDVYGYGHGCGLSQWGAIGYANNGWTYDAILTHYFSGVTLTTY